MASVPIIVEDTVNQSLREVEEHLEELHEATHEADEFIDIRTSKSAIQANLNLCSVKTVSIDSSGGGIERDSSGWAGEGVRPRSSRRRTRLSRKKIAQSRKTDLNEPEQVALFSKLVRIEENLSLEDLRVSGTHFPERRPPTFSQLCGFAETIFASVSLFSRRVHSRVSVGA